MPCSNSSTLPTSAIPGPRRMSIFSAVHEQVKFDRDPIRYMNEARTKYGDLVRYESLAGTLLLAFGPEYNRELHRETDLFYSRPFVLRGNRGSSQFRLRRSIFELNESEHRLMRHQLLPVFQRSRMDVYQFAIRGHVDQALKDWRAGQVRDLHRDMHLLVWSIVRDLLYGLDQNEASESLHEAMEHWMFQKFQPAVRAFPFNLPFTPFRRMVREADKLEQQFLTLIRQRRAEGIQGRDALSALLRCTTFLGGEIPGDQIVGHALILFLVAYETTGNMLTWTLFLLSQFPQIQRDLLDELQALGPSASYDQIEQAPLLTRVLKESTRLLPAVPYSRRFVSRDGTFGPYEVAHKTRIIFSHYMTHRLPEVYAEPNRFHPARWETIHPSPAEYMPFGAGLRTCLGSSLAQCIVRLAIARILPRWRIDVVPQARIDRKLGISLGPKNGIPVVLSVQDGQCQRSPVTGNIREIVNLDEPQPVQSLPVLAAA